ncbi:MAG: heavy metal translocating P-type ATPase [Calditrichia bacterium]
MEKTLKIEIPVLLPDVEDEQDQCIGRLLKRLSNHRGILQAHVDHRNGQAVVCLHFDPDYLSIEKVRRIAAQEGASISNRFHHLRLLITDMDCGDCAAGIEHIIGRVKGVLNVSVNYATEKMWAEYDSEKITDDEIIKRVKQLGYHVQEPERERNWFRGHLELVLALLSGVFLAAGFFGELWFGLPEAAAIALYALAYLTGGYDATRHGIKAVMHLRFDIDFLMVVAAAGAAVLGEWADGALLLFLFSFGHALEHAATDKARNAIRALGKITPKTARLRKNGQEMEVPLEKLQRGDVVIIKPGERIPIDGIIMDGNSSIDESPITGESVPVEKQEDEPVFAGAVNGNGALIVEVTRLAKDSTLSRIIQMVEEAQSQKSPTQRFTQRFQRTFVPAILIGVLVMIFLPPLTGWLSWSTAFFRAMSILVAASPCALAIATPAAVLSGIARAARNGVLIKGGAHLENLGAVQAIAFDKTGTLTEGKLQVTDIVPLNNTSKETLLKVAAAVESRSEHPLAKAIVAEAEARGVAYPPGEDLEALPGKGIQATVDKQPVWIGNTKLFNGQPDSELQGEILRLTHKLERGGKTTMIVKRERTFLGIIALADRPRKSAASTIKKLKALGIQALVMITGDNERVAAAISKKVGLTDFRASLLPDEKVEAIKKLLEQHRSVAMVGDGVNDAPAMTKATVGIAMGAGGSDVALETADVALMADDLSKLPFAVALSRQSRRIIKQNLIVALGVIALLIPATLIGLAGISIAIVFHEGSTLVVVANALRLLNFRG